MMIKLNPCVIPLALLLSPEFSLAQAPRLEEVQVTAQKRSESLNRVPLAIDVITSDILTKSAIDSLSQLENLSPSMNFGRAGRKARGEITIRGVGDFSRNIGTSARVAVYVDDVPLGRSSSYDLSLLSIDRVEILKGPQGTLFGTNSIAGAINIITGQPSEELSIAARASIGNFGYQNYSLNADIPLSPSVLSRVIIGHKESEGFIENIFLGETVQGDDSDTARINVLYSPSANLDIAFNVDWMQEEARSVNGLALNSEDPFKGFDYSPGDREVAHDSEEFERRKIFGGSITANWDLNSGIRLESISAIRGSEFSDLSDEDYSPAPIASSRFDEEFDQLSQEFRIVSPSEAKLSYVVGAFLLSQDLSTTRSANQLNPLDGSYMSVTTPGEMENDTAALFGNLNIDLNDTVFLDLGLRVQNEKKHLVFASIDTTGSFINGNIVAKESFDAILPRIALNFSIGDTGLLYYSVAKGAKSGGWNADFVRALNDLEFDQETATSFEVGYKNVFAESKARLSLTAFKTLFRDFQVFQFITKDNPQTGSETIIDITNAGEATSQGIEFDLSYQVTEAFSIHVNAVTLEANFDKFDNANATGDSFANNALPYAPKLSAFTGLEYRRNLSSDTEIKFQLDYTYSDEYFSNPNNEPLYRADSYYQTNATIALGFSERWTISLWGKNLSDETYLKYRDVSFTGVQRGYFAPPRSYGLTLAIN